MKEAEIVRRLAERADYREVLCIGMAIADIRPCELASESGISMPMVYQCRCAATFKKRGNEALMQKLLRAMERWKPGTLRRLWAAMTVEIPLLWEKEVQT